MRQVAWEDWSHFKDAGEQEGELGECIAVDGRQSDLEAGIKPQAHKPAPRLLGCVEYHIQLCTAKCLDTALS